MTWKDPSDPTRLTDKDLSKIFSNYTEHHMAKELLNSCHVVDPDAYESSSVKRKRKNVIYKLISCGCSISYKPMLYKWTRTRFSLTAKFHPEYVGGIPFNELPPEKLIELGFFKVKFNSIMIAYQIPTIYQRHIKSGKFFYSFGTMCLLPDLNFSFMQNPHYHNKPPMEVTDLQSVTSYLPTIVSGLNQMYLECAMLPYGNTKK